jgi:DNA topoisomerase-1
VPTAVRLRRTDLAGAGITRRRCGRGFAYRGPDGAPVRDPEVLNRIAALAIPPAWREVWISPHPGGHIQAVGTDAAGRRQYRYHDRWREERDRAKFDRVLAIAESLPAVRAQAATAMGSDGLGRERVLGCAVRLLDLGFFRVGGEQYAEEHGSYGLATLLREHVSVDGDELTFDYPAKSGQHRVHAVVDPLARAVVAQLLERDDPGPELLAFRTADGWQDVRSSDINDHLRQLAGLDVSAKDFRTWSATVLAAVGLAVSAGVAASTPARKRAVSRVVREVAHYLGNTPTVCRASYIDPRVIDRFDDGLTIAAALDDLATELGPGRLATQGAVERAVVELLREPTRRRARRPARRPGSARGGSAHAAGATAGGARAGGAADDTVLPVAS